MGGEGSGNEGRRKFGNKFYEFQGAYSTEAQAEHVAESLNHLKTKIIHELHETVWVPHNEVIGWSVYYVPKYHRKSRREKLLPKSGTRKYY